jgi:hypothetical protein
MRRRYRILGLSVPAAAQTGCVFGLIIGALPSLLNMLVIGFFAHNLYELLNKTNVTVLTVNLADQLSLRPTIESLKGFDQPLTYLLLFLIGIVAVGVLLGGLAALSAVAYNRLFSRFGGLNVTLEEIAPTTSAAGQIDPRAGIQPPPVQTLSSGSAGAVLPNRPVTAPPVAPQLLQSRPAQPSPINAAPPLPTAAGPRLCLASNPNQVWFINRSPFTLGSNLNPRSDVYAGSLLSQHARLDYDLAARGHVLTDLSNGQVWVNGRQIQNRHLLKDGYRLQLGSTEFIYYT